MQRGRPKKQQTERFEEKSNKKVKTETFIMSDSNNKKTTLLEEEIERFVERIKYLSPREQYEAILYENINPDIMPEYIRKNIEEYNKSLSESNISNSLEKYQFIVQNMRNEVIFNSCWYDDYESAFEAAKSSKIEFDKILQFGAVSFHTEQNDVEMKTINSKGVVLYSFQVEPESLHFN